MLLACNVVTLVFAFFNPPVVVSVLFLYWAECLVIGLLNIAKLWYVEPISGVSESELAQMTPKERFSHKGLGIGIFVAHYGLFLFGVFGVMLTLGRLEMAAKGVRDFHMASHVAVFWLPVLLMGVGHTVSFFRNFLGKREFAGRNYHDQMIRPYKRTFLLLLIMFGGGFLITATGQPGAGVLVFVPFMLIASLDAHFRERAA